MCQVSERMKLSTETMETNPHLILQSTLSCDIKGRLTCQMSHVLDGQGYHVILSKYRFS